MTARHAVLPVGAVLVLGLGVYLLIAVRRDPAPLYAARERPPRIADPEPSPRTDEVAPPRAASAAAPEAGVAATPAAPAGPGESDPALAGPKLDAVMAEANKAYDRGELDEARTIAGRVLARIPGNVRMLRIMVSAACIEGDSAVAQAHFARLPPGDQEQMKVRCARYGISFQDSP